MSAAITNYYQQNQMDTTRESEEKEGKGSRDVISPESVLRKLQITNSGKV